MVTNSGHQTKDSYLHCLVDIPMTLEVASEFKNIIGYRSGSDMLMTKISTMLYTYMRDNNMDKALCRIRLRPLRGS